jgi:hypothetical protein
MNLGKQNKNLNPETSPASPDAPKITYPGFNLSDEVAEAFLKECDCKLGDEITATVRLKVTRQSADEYGKSVGFDVMSLDNIKYPEEGSGDEKPKSGEKDEEVSEDESEEKALGYKRPTAKKETPSLSAEDLE